MTGKHQALEDNENKMDETPVTAAPPGNQAIDPPPTAEDDGETGTGVLDPSTTAEDEAQMDQEAAGKTRTGSLDPNPSLKEVLGLVRQVSTQIQQAQKNDGGRLKIGTRKLVEITDKLAAHAEEARSLLDELVAAGERERDLGKADDRIEETITGYREDFHRRGDAERQRRWWLPGLALAVAAPAFLLLGVMIEQQFLIVPLNDPSRGWSGHIWDNYGPTIANCAMEAKRKNQVVKCPLDVHKP